MQQERGFVQKLDASLGVSETLATPHFRQPPRPPGGGNGRMRLLGRAALASSLYRLARVHLQLSLTSLCCGFQFWNAEKHCQYWFLFMYVHLHSVLSNQTVIF